MLSVRVDDALAAKLAEVADSTQQPVSAVVREALTRWLESTPRKASTLLASAGSVTGAGVSATNANVRAKLQRTRRAQRIVDTGPLVALMR